MNPTSSLEYLEYAPAGPLAARVRCLWALRAPVDPAAAFEPVFPDGCPEVVLNLAAPFERAQAGEVEQQARALLVGQLLEPIRLRPTGRTDIVGIRFQPWGLRGNFGAAPVELAGRTGSAALIHPALADTIPARLAAIPNLEQRCEALERFLLELGLGREAPGAPRAVAALAAGTIRSVTRAAGLAGISCRQVERQCAAWVGLGPHDLIRLARFQRALAGLRHHPGRTLTWVAHASGFADQAHFSRDFTRFAGLTPSAFRRSMGDLTVAFIPGPDEGA